MAYLDEIVFQVKVAILATILNSLYFPCVTPGSLGLPFNCMSWPKSTTNVNIFQHNGPRVKRNGIDRDIGESEYFVLH